MGQHDARQTPNESDTQHTSTQISQSQTKLDQWTPSVIWLITGRRDACIPPVLLVEWRFYQVEKKVVFAHSEIWLVVELGEEKMQLQRKLEEVDREAGKMQEDMPTLEMPYSELQ